MGKQKKGYIHSVSSKEYGILLRLAEGRFSKPVKERSRMEKSAVVKYWRHKEEFSVDSGGDLLFNGKKVVKDSDISRHVSRTFNRNKGGSARKLRYRAANGLAGLSEKKILAITTKEKKYRIHNARFTNKSKMKPIIAKNVQKQHQIDLVNLSRMKVVHRGKMYRYVFSLMDIFSRYHWLRPLTNKSSSEVAKHLRSIYCEHGHPSILQSDRGTEFKKNVKSLCKRLKIKRICSRPYHPQAQGKIERSHQELKRKITFDLIKMRNKGVNWAKNLENYQQVLNESAREELGWQTPFQVYYGRQSNRLKVEHSARNDVSASYLGPSSKELSDRQGHIEKTRHEAKIATERVAARVVAKASKSCTTYEVNDQVLIRFGKQKGKFNSRRHILEARIIKKGRNDNYKVMVLLPGEKAMKKIWVNVEDIAAGTLNNEVKRTSKMKYAKQKYLIPLTIEDRLDDFKAAGYKVSNNPAMDGDCQFHALAFSLQSLGIHRSASGVRRDVLLYLNNNPNNLDGIPFAEFIEVSWTDYLEAMAEDGEWGDHITLQAAANFYSLEIRLISSLGRQCDQTILAENSLPLFKTTLGHFAEGDGDHYVNLTGSEGLDDADLLIDKQLDSDDLSDKSDDCDQTILPENSLPLFKTTLGHFAEGDGDHYVNLTGSEEVDDADLLIDKQLDSDNLSNKSDDVDVASVVLPPEIWLRIIRYSLNSNDTNWPNHICKTFNSLNDTCSSFRHLIIAYNLHRHLPRLYCANINTIFGEKIYDPISTVKLIRTFGSRSGFLLSLKEVISSSRWNSAWIKLRPDKYGWHYVSRIFWKKMKN